MRNRLLQPRLLPIGLACVCGVLVLKAFSVWTGVAAEEALPPAAAAAPVQAAFATAAGASVSTPNSGDQSAAADAAVHGPGQGENGLLDDGAGEFSEEELKLLHKLADRREALATRARDIDRREALLGVAEARIVEKVARLEDLRVVLESLIDEHDAEQASQINSLVKIYENMKPKDAARIFEELDMATLLPVVERMKERKLAAIMARMNPSKAKEVTVELAQRQRVIDQSADFSLPQG